MSASGGLEIIQVPVSFPLELFLDLERISTERKSALEFLLLTNMTILRRIIDTALEESVPISDESQTRDELEKYFLAKSVADAKMMELRLSPPSETISGIFPMARALHDDMEKVAQKLGDFEAADFVVRSGYFAQALLGMQ